MELQREFELPVVAAELSTVTGAPFVELRIVVNIEGRQKIRDRLTVDVAEFGWPESDVAEDVELTVPAAVRQWTAAWATANLQPDDVLWLQLVKPYGGLGAVPWERDLQPGLGRPMLRLPDVLPSPTRTTSQFDVAIVAATAPTESETVAPVVGATARAIAAGSAERLRLHIFAHPNLAQRLGEELDSLPIRQPVVHRYPDHPSSGSRSTKRESDWLGWVRDAASAQAFDAVHFVVHGEQLGSDGAIALPLSPTGGFHFAQAAEVSAFLTQVGALIAVFTRPPDNRSDYGLRRLADELGANRAGPVVLHEPGDGPTMTELTDCYRFLSALEPAIPPASSRLMLYVQPAQVDGVANAEFRLESASPVESSAIRLQLENDPPQSWVVAAQRYIEGQEAEVLRFDQMTHSRQPTPAEEAHYAGLKAGLNRIRDIVERHVGGPQ